MNDSLELDLDGEQHGISSNVSTNVSTNTVYEVYLLNQTFQCFLICGIILVAILLNGLIIHNIGSSQVRQSKIPSSS